MTRSVTDILWTGSTRVRAWRGGDIRAVYYSVLVLVVVWGIIALKLAQPVMLLQIGANIAGVIFVVRVTAPAVSEHTRTAEGAAATDVATGGAGCDGRVLRILRGAGGAFAARVTQRLRLISIPLPTSRSTESRSPAWRTRAR